MAYTQFYIQSASSSDLNSGDTTGSTLTYAGGTFVRATGVYTVASGDPQNDGVTVGTFASVYTTSGATTTKCIGQISARDHTTITIDVTTPVIYGAVTNVSETANASTCKVGGPHATLLPWSSGGINATTPASLSTKVNIKQATYSQGASLTFATAGLTTHPVWFSGYNATPGDLDNDTTNSLTKPVIALGSTFQLNCTGNFQIWSGLSVTGSRSGTIWNLQGSPVVVSRCRSENTSSNAAAIAFTLAISQGVCAYSWFKCPTTATTTGTISVGGNGSFIGCVSEGGGLAGWNGGANNYSLIDCIALNNTGAGVLSSTGQVKMVNLTVVSSGGTVDGVKWTSTPGAYCWVIGMNCQGPNGGTAITNGINNASGTNTMNVYRACNNYYNVTNAEVGMGDTAAFFGQTDSAFGLTSTTDMTPVSGSNARAHGFPGIFENETFSSYVNIGAVQQVATAGSVGLFIQ